MNDNTNESNNTHRTNKVIANQRSWYQYITLSLKHNIVVATSCAPYCFYASGVLVTTVPAAVLISGVGALAGTVAYGVLCHKTLFHLGHQLCGYKVQSATNESKRANKEQEKYDSYWKYWLIGVLFHASTAFLEANVMAFSTQYFMPWGQISSGISIAIPTNAKAIIDGLINRIDFSYFTAQTASKYWVAHYVEQVPWINIVPVLYSVFISPWILDHIIITGRFNDRDLKEELDSAHCPNIAKRAKEVLNYTESLTELLKLKKYDVEIRQSEKDLEGYKEKICKFVVQEMIQINKQDRITMKQDYTAFKKGVEKRVQEKLQDKQWKAPQFNWQEHLITESVLQNKLATIVRKFSKPKQNFHSPPNNTYFITQAFKDKFGEEANANNIYNCRFQNAQNPVDMLQRLCTNLNELVSKLNELNTVDNNVEKTVIQNLTEHATMMTENDPLQSYNCKYLRDFGNCIENLPMNSGDHKMLAVLLDHSIEKLEAQIEQYKADKKQYEAIQSQKTNWSAIKMVISPCVIGVFNATIQLGCAALG